MKTKYILIIAAILVVLIVFGIRYWQKTTLSIVGMGEREGKQEITVEYQSQRVDIEKGTDRTIGKYRVDYGADGKINVFKGTTLVTTVWEQHIELGKRLN